MVFCIKYMFEVRLKIDCYTFKFHFLIPCTFDVVIAKCTHNHCYFWMIKSLYLKSILVLFINPSARAGYDTRSIFKQSLTVWIQSFPSPRLVASPRLKNLVCLTLLPIAGGRIIGFIPFPRVLVLCEMQSFLVQDLNSSRRVHFLRR